MDPINPDGADAPCQGKRRVKVGRHGECARAVKVCCPRHVRHHWSSIIKANDKQRRYASKRVDSDGAGDCHGCTDTFGKHLLKNQNPSSDPAEQSCGEKMIWIKFSLDKTTGK